MPLADGYEVEKILEGISFQIAEALTEHFTDIKPLPHGIIPAFALFLVDRNSGAVKYISDIKDNVAVVEMLKRVLGERQQRVAEQGGKVKSDEVDLETLLNPTEQDKTNKPN